MFKVKTSIPTKAGAFYEGFNKKNRYLDGEVGVKLHFIDRFLNAI